MELKWIEDFLHLAESGNFSRSAAARHVTQPAFSRRIQALEAWLGVELVDRSTYPTRLTAAGEAFREEALALVSRLYGLRAGLRGDGPLAQEAIRFAVPHTLALTFFPRWLTEIEARFGPITSKLFAANVHDAVMTLVNGDCDLLLCYHHPNQPLQLDPAHYPMLRLASETVLPVVRPNARGKPAHRLPGKPAAPVPMLAYAPNAYLGRVVDLILHKAAAPCHLERRYETDMAEALKVMALHGHGVAWLPASTIEKELDAGLLVPAGGEEWSLTIDIRLYCDRERMPAHIARVWEFAATNYAANA